MSLAHLFRPVVPASMRDLPGRKVVDPLTGDETPHERRMRLMRAAGRAAYERQRAVRELARKAGR